VLRQRNRSGERAVSQEDQVPGHDPVPVTDDRTITTADDQPQPAFEAEPSPVAGDTTWASPSGVPVEAQPVKMHRPISWGQVLIFLAGAASVVFGVGAVILGGLAGSVTAPVVRVFTYEHTPLLGSQTPAS